MNRPSHVLHGLSASILVGCAAWLSTCFISDAYSADTTRPPNFIVILADDLGYGDIGSFGSKVNRTPHLDRMAKEGMRLTSFYANPVCTPSRAQLMTGCYAKRVSMPRVIFPICPTGLSPQENTVAKLLKRQGYATLCVGKWHLGDQPEFLPTRHGFDHYFGLPYSNDMKGKPPLPLLRDETVIEAPAVQETLVERYTAEAVKFITENRDQPFFLYMPHTAVHVPLYPGEKFRGKSANGNYGDWVEELDNSVGQVLDTLRKLELQSNTLVLFTSDNGPWLAKGKAGGVAGPLRSGKGTIWEGGVRVPTIAWWPGRVPESAASDLVCANLDVLPTFVKLAGAQPPAEPLIDGKDISPILFGKAKESPHQALFLFQADLLKGVRSGPWKLSLGDPELKKKGADKTAQLYNLENDLGETTDLAEKHPDIVERLRGYLKDIDADLGISEKGPGVRPCGKVAAPQPLLKP